MVEFLVRDADMARHIWVFIRDFSFFFHSASTRTRSHLDRKQFLLYAIYAFGLPLVLTLVAHAFDSAESLEDYLRPGFGVENCFIKGIDRLINHQIAQFNSCNGPIHFRG